MNPLQKTLPCSALQEQGGFIFAAKALLYDLAVTLMNQTSVN
jgi:hypothetical protein